jgi:hypothetical protein
VEEEFEVPSPHENAFEEAVELGQNNLNQKIALMTAVLATIGALIGYQSGAAQNEAMFLKNESILKQAEASDQWNFYQSKSTKKHIAEATLDLTTNPEIRAKYLAQQGKQVEEMVEIQREAKALQAESHRLSDASEAKLKPHERFALALTFIQIGIALAAITVLTRKRWLLWGSVCSAAIGVIAAASAVFLL